MSRNYLILGASSDVGVELLKEITNKECDATIWAHYFMNDKLIKSVEQKNGNSIIPLRADFSNADDIDGLYSTMKNSGKMPTSIVHLPAPKLKYERFSKISWEDCINDVQIQVGAIFRLLQLILPQILKSEYKAKVVFMLSENTINSPARFSTKYTMSKYMLLGLMRSLVVEYEGKNININALSPSIIDTKLLSEIDRRMLEVYGATDHILHPREVIPWLWRLLSEYSDNMNGENVLFSGGGDSIE